MDMKSFANKTKSDNSKSKKARVVSLVCDKSSCPDLHFYQGYSSYRADKKFYADADANKRDPFQKQYVPHPPLW